MSKDEVQKLSDEDLKSSWNQIVIAYNSSLPQCLSNHQSLILFADFVNVGDEMSKRGFETKKNK